MAAYPTCCVCGILKFMGVLSSLYWTEILIHLQTRKNFVTFFLLQWTITINYKSLHFPLTLRFRLRRLFLRIACRQAVGWNHFLVDGALHRTQITFAAHARLALSFLRIGLYFAVCLLFFVSIVITISQFRSVISSLCLILGRRSNCFTYVNVY